MYLDETGGGGREGRFLCSGRYHIQESSEDPLVLTPLQVTEEMAGPMAITHDRRLRDSARATWMAHDLASRPVRCQGW